MQQDFSDLNVKFLAYQKNTAYQMLEIFTIFFQHPHFQRCKKSTGLMCLLRFIKHCKFLIKYQVTNQRAYLPVSFFAAILRCVFSESLIKTTYIYQYTMQYSLGEQSSNSKPKMRKREAIQYVCSSTQRRICWNIFTQKFCKTKK